MYILLFGALMLVIILVVIIALIYYAVKGKNVLDVISTSKISIAKEEPSSLMSTNQLYTQINSFLSSSDPERAVQYIRQLKETEVTCSKELQRLENTCLEQLYYLLNDALEKCDFESARRLISSYLLLKKDVRIVSIQKRFISLEEQDRLKNEKVSGNQSSVVGKQMGSEGESTHSTKKLRIVKIAAFILILGFVTAVIIYLSDREQEDNAEAAAVETTMISENNGKSASNRHGWVLSRAYFCEGDMAGFPIQMNICLDDVGVITGFYKNVRYGTELQLSGDLDELGYLQIKAENRNESVTFLLSKDSDSTLYGYGENTAKRLAVHLRIRE